MKNSNLSFRLKKEDKEFIESKAKSLNLSIHDLIISSIKQNNRHTVTKKDLETLDNNVKWIREQQMNICDVLEGKLDENAITIRRKNTNIKELLDKQESNNSKRYKNTAYLSIMLFLIVAFSLLFLTHSIQ